MTQRDADILEQAQDLEDHAKAHTKARVEAQKEAEFKLGQIEPETAARRRGTYESAKDQILARSN